MIIGEAKYTIMLTNSKTLYAAIAALHEDPLSGLIKEAAIKNEGGYAQLVITVLLIPNMACESILKMFPSLEKVLFPLSWKEKNKQ